MEEDLAVVILPDYIHHKSGPTTPTEWERRHSSSSQESHLNEDLAIVILPDYLDNEDRNIQPKPPAPKSKKRKRITKKVKKNTQWVAEKIKPVHLSHETPFSRWKGHLILGRRAYTNFLNFSLLAFLLALFLNVVIGPINGTGGEVHFDGANAAYSPMAQDLIKPGELYPCDPSIQSNGCRNSFTPFFSESDSMPRGVYPDTQIFAIIGLLTLFAVNWTSSSIRSSNHGVKIEQAVSYDSFNPERHLASSQQIERYDWLRFSFTFLFPIVCLLIVAHLSFMHIPGEGRPVEFDGHKAIDHPDAPSLYLNPGDVYPCDSAIQIGTCDHLLRPSLGGEWIVPVGYYPVHLVMLSIGWMLLFTTVSLNVELNRARRYKTIYQQQKIGVSSGKLGLELFKDISEFGIHQVNIHHLHSRRRKKQSRALTIDAIATNMKMHQRRYKRVLQVENNSSAKIWGFITEAMRKIFSLPKILAKGIWRFARWLASPASYFLSNPKTNELTRQYRLPNFDAVDHQPFTMKVDFAKVHVPNRRLYGFKRVKMATFLPNIVPKLNPTKTSSLSRKRLKPKSQVDYSQPMRRLENWRIRGKMVGFSAKRIPFTFLHVDEHTMGGKESVEFSDPTVLFVHDSKNHKILVDIRQLD